MTGFPRMKAYLASLPGGTTAYPAYEAKASLVRFMLEVCPPPTDVSELPSDVASVLTDPPPANVWISEALHFACTLALADHHKLDERGVRSFWFEQMSLLVQSPLYRGLLTSLTPQTLLKTAGMRWTGFHRGMELEAAESGEDAIELVLRHPPGLVTPFLAEGFVGCFHALGAASTVPGMRVKLAAVHPSRATFRMAWGAEA
ncbi:MAG: hypothetical protein H6720_16875 [Sandaracinus sp.]|nr:hypothetical protein [Myxococcales bacterium]MCB9601993.1 hypothetical protein [Sandaracinus sp.]